MKQLKETTTLARLMRLRRELKQETTKRNYNYRAESSYTLSHLKKQLKETTTL
jgi:hypothetical protein